MTKFLFWMLLASGLGFIKLIALAYVMPTLSYGQYVSHFGIATLAGAILSAGLIEQTIKAYPRQWVTGQRSDILINAKKIARILALRFGVIGATGIALAWLGIFPSDPIEVVWITALGLCAAWLALLASLYRAAGSQRALQNFSWWRSAATLALALPGGWLLGWQGAMLGDIGASVIGVVIAILQLPKLYANPVESSIQQPQEQKTSGLHDSGHQKLYFANLLTSSVVMVDKAWINAAIGSALAGAYSVIMLIPQVAQLLINVLVQLIGPLVIKFTHLKHRDTSRISAVGLQAVLLAVFSALLTLGALIGKRLPYLDHLFDKFGISDLSLILAGVISAGQIYSIIEFHLIARDRESDVLRASLVSTFIFFGLFTLASYWKLDIEWFVAAAGIARWSQVWMLKRAYVQDAS